MQVSILVVSRTPELLNRFCASLDQASSLPAMEMEILCSWNGSKADEARIHNSSRYDLHIAQRVPYHFSGNMNGLAAKAGGEVLMLANDDLILDASCVDAGLRLLNSNPDIGLVGALLRDQDDLISHAGINFDPRFSSYHLLDRMLSSSELADIPSAPVGAITGALQWIARQDFQQHPYNTAYKVCGEDIELCMDVQQALKKQVWLCTEATAVHEAETTRSKDESQAGNSEDQIRLRARVKAFIEQASKKQLKVLLMQQQRESMHLRDLVAGQLGEELKLEREEQEKVLLDLREERLRLKQQLELAGGKQ
ncbi:MAG: hypothetical protein GKR83_05500 [Synechococcus sp. s2_metabat2_7]|nr:hypothetical protein [Synechococcus sp. s2_metabat2_7]